MSGLGLLLDSSCGAMSVVDFVLLNPAVVSCEISYSLYAYDDDNSLNPHRS